MVDARTRLLEAAETLIDTGRTVSLDATAELAGVGRSTAYRHFSGRQDLLLQVATVRSARLLDQAMEMVAGEGTAAGRLRQVLMYLFAEIPRDPVLAEFAAEGPHAIDDAAAREAANTFLEPLIVEGQARNEFRSDYPPSEAVRWIITQLFTALHMLPDDAGKFLDWFEWFVLPSLAVTANPATAKATIAQTLRSHARALEALADSLPVE